MSQCRAGNPPLGAKLSALPGAASHMAVLSAKSDHVSVGVASTLALADSVL